MAVIRERSQKPRSETPLKTDFVRARINPATKIEAEAVLGAIGLSLSDAFRLMITRVILIGAYHSSCLSQPKRQSPLFAPISAAT